MHLKKRLWFRIGYKVDNLLLNCLLHFSPAALNIPKSSSSHDRNKQEPDTSGVSGSKRAGSENRKDKKGSKKQEKKKRHKKHQSSSSDSSSNSSDSSDSSSDSDSSSSDSSSSSGKCRHGAIRDTVICDTLFSRLSKCRGRMRCPS